MKETLPPDDRRLDTATRGQDKAARNPPGGAPSRPVKFRSSSYSPRIFTDPNNALLGGFRIVGPVQRSRSLWGHPLCRFSVSFSSSPCLITRNFFLFTGSFSRCATASMILPKLPSDRLNQPGPARVPKVDTSWDVPTKTQPARDIQSRFITVRSMPCRDI